VNTISEAWNVSRKLRAHSVRYCGKIEVTIFMNPGPHSADGFFFIFGDRRLYAYKIEASLILMHI